MGATGLGTIRTNVNIPSDCDYKKTQGHVISSTPCANYSKLKWQTGFKVLHFNISSLISNLSELIHIVHDLNIDVISLNETRLDVHIYNDELKIPEYKLFRKDRNRNGGGVALYIHSRINPSALNIQTNIESVWATVKTKSRNINIGSIYRPPSSLASYFDNIIDCIEQATQNGYELIILGDLNFNCITSDNSVESHVEMLQNTFDVKQLIHSPTRVTPHTSTLIDHIYASNSLNSVCSGYIHLVINHLVIIIWSTRFLTLKNVKLFHSILDVVTSINLTMIPSFVNS